MKKVLILLVIALSALLLVGCQTQGAQEAQQEAMQDEAPSQGAGEQVAQERQVKTTQVEILGPDGFSPESLTINAGEALTWTNQNPKEKDVTLTIQMEGTRDFETSDILEVGDSYSYTFQEAGTYQFWTVGYGIFGEVTVN